MWAGPEETNTQTELPLFTAMESRCNKWWRRVLIVSNLLRFVAKLTSKVLQLAIGTENAMHWSQWVHLGCLLSPAWAATLPAEVKAKYMYEGANNKFGPFPLY